MQQRLCVPAWLRQAFKNQVSRGLVRHRRLKVTRHLLVQLVSCVLAVNHRRHALESFVDLRFAHHAVQQPVGHVLA